MNLHNIEHPDEDLARRATRGYRKTKPEATFRRRAQDPDLEFEVQDYPNTTWYRVRRTTAEYWATRA